MALANAWAGRSYTLAERAAAGPFDICSGYQCMLHGLLHVQQGLAAISALAVSTARKLIDGVSGPMLVTLAALIVSQALLS